LFAAAATARSQGTAPVERAPALEVAPKPERAPAPEQAKRLPWHKVWFGVDIVFDDGAVELSDAARTVLDDVVERVEKFKPELVVALGFTDGKLSAQRSHLLSL